MSTTKDNTLRTRIKESVAGTSPTPNVWVVASQPTDGDVSRLKIFAVFRDNANPTDFSSILAEGILSTTSGTASLTGSPQNQQQNFNTVLINSNGTDIELSLDTAVAQLDVEISVEFEQLG